MYQKAKLEIIEDNIEKGLQIIKKIFQHSYPIQDTRGLYKLYERVSLNRNMAKKTKG
ncbi:MAG: hypothetical protein GX023_02195 [Tissierellia bacterium]|nr:hypothetical protein [Tissierellia bacterium]